MIAAVLVFAATLSAPEALVRKFCTAYLKTGGFGLLVGRDRARLAPMLSTRLLEQVDGYADCQRDWIRQQPKDSTDKPPFVDCCLFSGMPEGAPSSFRVSTSKRLPDGRVEVVVDFRIDNPSDHMKWRDGLIVKMEDGRWVIDDMRFDIDDEAVLLSKPYEHCRDGKWIGGV